MDGWGYSVDGWGYSVDSWGYSVDGTGYSVDDPGVGESGIKSSPLVDIGRRPMLPMTLTVSVRLDRVLPLRLVAALPLDALAGVTTDGSMFLFRLPLTGGPSPVPLRVPRRG